MEYTINVTFIPHLLDMDTYAKLCGIDKRGLQKRMRNKWVAYTTIDGLTLFDSITSPPVKKLPYRYKPERFVLHTGGHNLSNLIRVSKLAKTKRITADRFYRYILLGRLKAVMIMGEAFVYKTDPVIQLLLTNYIKEENYTPTTVDK